MKRLLVLADAYAPPSYSPRLRSLCQYWVSQGWEVEVYTERFAPIDFEHDYPIEEIPFYKGRIDWAVKAVWSLLTDWKDRHFARQVEKKLQNKSYDLVFCTTFSTFPLPAALRIAKKRNLPLHLDIRDLDEQVAGSQYLQHRARWTLPFRRLYNAVQIKRRNRVLEQAQSISTVSEWHQQFLLSFNSNVHLVYNGFDSTLFEPHDCPSPRFELLYTGRIYEQPLQDPTPLFEALPHLRHLEHLRVVFYTSPSGQKRLQALGERYGVTDLVEYHDYVPFSAVPDLICHASIGLVLSNKTTADGPFGVLGTKLYEYLGAEKPVLCVKSDEDLMARLIAYTHLGVAATTKEQVIDFVEAQYRIWRQQGFTRQPVAHKDCFDRAQQAVQLTQILIPLLPQPSPCSAL